MDDQLKVTSYSNNFVDNSIMMGAPMDKDQVITADGHVRNVITINGQFPGPNIEVMEGAEVSDDVWMNMRVGLMF